MNRLAAQLLILLALGHGLVSGQAPAPNAGAPAAALRALAQLGARQLERDDPLEARQSYLLLDRFATDDVESQVGLGEVHLRLGRPAIALHYALEALRRRPADDAAAALEVRALLRARRFREALDRSTALVAARGADAGAQLWAAHASALFRVQRIDAAAAAYREVLRREPLHAEAHLRLGSGLTRARDARLDGGGAAALAAQRAGRLDEAIDGYARALRRDPGNPMLHRLLGEALLLRRARHSILRHEPAFARLRELADELVAGELDGEVLAAFMPQLVELDGERREVAMRALRLFGSRLPRIVGRSGRHDLLTEDERTTDAAARRSLKGERTFDGRVWDDVRGIGGLRAATGIEALDEAAGYGFDTLAHEVAHQVHLYGCRSRVVDVRIRMLYREAKAAGRWLDYYAASNHAEYFAQGVEAFHCLAKRPANEPTHGHTRFELLRVDPRLHDLVAELVDVDPLAGPTADERRVELLLTAIDAALRTGRSADAVTAAELLPAGQVRDAARARARAAARRSRSI